MVRHWLLLATQEAERRGERGRERRHQAALFCADDGMIGSSDPRWLEWVFTILVGIFDRVGLKTNQRKTVSMACRPCSAAGNISETSYAHTMTGKGLLPRAEERPSNMRGLWARDGGGITRFTPHVPTWEGKGAKMDMDGCNNGEGRAQDISDGIPKRRSTDMPTFAPLPSHVGTCGGNLVMPPPSLDHNPCMLLALSSALSATVPSPSLYVHRMLLICFPPRCMADKPCSRFCADSS